MSSRTAVPVSVLLVTAALAVSSVPGHPRSYRHRHHHRSGGARAVIVVGKPRPAQAPVIVRGRPAGVLDVNVKPKATELWVDGSLRGTVGEFDGRPQKLHLVAGEHRVKLVTPDGVSVARNIRVRAGVEIDVGLDLR